MPWPPESDEWHYAYGVSDSTTDDDLAGHGSCVASKAAGWKTGVSKNSQLVVMKSLPTLADVNFAFAAALDDIIEKDRQGRAVVVFPATSIQTFGPGSVLPRNWRSVKELIRELFGQDVVVVTASGNSAARSSAMNTVPAIWGLDPDFPLIVAGAVTTSGTIARFSQGAASRSEIVWAPGESIVCANGPSSPGLAVRSGTSFAAAMVSNHPWAPAHFPSIIALTRKLYVPRLQDLQHTNWLGPIPCAQDQYPATSALGSLLTVGPSIRWQYRKSFGTDNMERLMHFQVIRPRNLFSNLCRECRTRRSFLGSRTWRRGKRQWHDVLVRVA